ncbi:MAG: hypothetical protein IID53_11605 [Proteobacteria bacterium]|nr:hypothetical protein [Pseudomonadota bacterium]
MADDNAPGSKQEKTDEKEEFVEKMVLVNPNLIEHYWIKNEGTRRFVKSWSLLCLHVKDYEFVRTYNFLSTDVGGDLADIIDKSREADGLEPAGEKDEEKEKQRMRLEFRHLAKRAEENFDGLSKKEQTEFSCAHLKDVRPAQQRSNLRLVGWAKIEARSSIEVLSVATKEEADQVKYKKYFDGIFFFIQETENDDVGLLRHWTKESREFQDDDPGEDYLDAIMFVKKGTLAELEHEIRQRGGSVPLDIVVEAHLFQHELQETVLEPRDRRHYNVIYDTDCSIILNSIRVGSVPRLETDHDEAGSHWDEEAREDVPDPDAQFREGILSAVSNLSASLGHIKIALWLLAIFFLLSLFV